MRIRAFVVAVLLVAAAATSAHAADPGFILPAPSLVPSFGPATFTGVGRIAMSPDGTAFVVYSNGGDASNAQWLRVRPPGGDWSAPLPLTAVGTYGANAIAVDGQSSATVFYFSQDSDLHMRVAARTITSSGALGDQQFVSTPGVNAVLIDADGDGAGHVAVMWATGSGDVFVRHRSAGTDFTPAIDAPALANAPNGVTTGAVATAGNGETAAAWAGFHDGTHTTADVTAQMLGGSPRTLSVLNGVVGGLDVAGSPTGNVVATFTQNGATSLASNGAEFVSTRAPGGGFTASTAPGPADLSQAPRAALDASGKGYIVWNEPTIGAVARRVVLATASPGGTVGDPVPISDGVGAVNDGGGIAVDPAGDVLLGWWQANGNPPAGQVYKGAFIPAGGTPTVTTISGPAINFASYATLHGQPALDANGDGLLSQIGDQLSSDGNVLRGVEFDHGPLLGGLSVPATGVAGTSLSFGVAPVGVWAPVSGDATWSFGDGTSATGASVTHTFAVAGSYAVTVSATNTRGVVSSRTQTVAVAPAPAASVMPPPTVKPKVFCIVPTLTGKTLTAATSALKKAHCALGKVTKPKKLKGRPKLVVHAQSRKAKTKLTSGTRVNLTLAVAKTKKKPTKRH
jgi:PKD domain